MGYLAGWRLVRSLPEPVVDRSSRAAADAAWRRRGAAVRRLESNVARLLAARDGRAADPAEVRAVARRGLRTYARYWHEAFRLPALGAADVAARFPVVGTEHLDAAVASGRGAVLALPHMGNWDLAGAWLTGRGVPFTTVAERLEPAVLFEAFVAFREGLGMEVLPLTGGRRPPAALLSERLRAGGVLCLLADRDLSRHGVEVELAGARTRVPAGPARLALQTGAVLLPVTTWHPDDLDEPGARGRVHPPLPHPAPADPGRPDADLDARTAALSQSLVDVLAHGPDGLLERPGDWHMLQRLWLDDLAGDDPRRRVPAGTAR